MNKSKNRSPWPLGIVVVLGIFATFIVTIAVFLSKKNFDLVSTDYYSQSVNYNDIMSARGAFDSLAEKPSVLVNDSKQQINFSFPSAYASKVGNLSVQFFKPDDAKQDFEMPIEQLVSKDLNLDYSSMRKGIWNLSLHWEMNGTSYLLEDEIKLQ